MIKDILEKICPIAFLSAKDFFEASNINYPCAIYDERGRNLDHRNPFFERVRARVFFCFLPKNKEEEKELVLEGNKRIQAFAEALPIPAAQFSTEYFFSNYTDLVCGASAEIEFSLPKKPCQR